ncbi:beta 1-4 rhamnosyltransferase Cps2T [Streptococcus catagoni]|uniref:beta 1-4 rhamnosyltransferase Cps2T n=1 Tax=Streptococcus catagoni TaxID=2654874 RepID=UPI0014086F21|nr:glycosyltransferase family 1 protein [Streptococcus catagoni]
MQNIFIIGSRGLPAKYGGFETFVEELVSHQVSENIQYHIACLSDRKHQKHFDYKGADCFYIKPPKIGPARVIAYDMMAINYALKYIDNNHIKNPIFYILGNTIGAFMGPFLRKIKQRNGRFYINPDGLEWKRSKWSKPVQNYLKYAEKQMTKYADLVISDNLGIESYIKETYPWAKTRFIAYGTEILPSNLSFKDSHLRDYFDCFKIKEKDYYLLIGRFVPENNYLTIIKEFMQSQTKRDLLIICNHEGNSYFETLKAETAFESDPRIKFVGTQYDRELLTYIRENAFAYIHGHEVGGTNPGLLEALAHTNLNLVFGVDFNRSVAKDSALYWSKKDKDLAQLIDSVDPGFNDQALGKKAKEIIREEYTWQKIVGEYEALFLNEN